ncbi:class I SAM-dependent methyltransferase [Candidatus Microgenomates bacterium]|nr:class I SAM-dependent methyltransferase [Candidatus Microgenomates bacterium]
MKSLLNRYLKTLWLHSAALNNRILASYIEPGKGLKILDLGVDDGSMLLERIEGKIIQPKLFGTDIEPEKLRRTREKGIQAIRANVEKPLPFKDNFFDVVSANQIIEHIVKVDQFVSEIYRVLKPGGYLVLSTENLSSWHNIFALTLGWQAFSQHISRKSNIGNPLRLNLHNPANDVTMSGMHIKTFTPLGLKELLELYGFVIEDTFGAGHYPFPLFISKALSILDPTHAAFIGLKARKVARNESL